MKYLLLFLLLLSSVFASDFYQVKELSIKGEPFKMEDLKGKTVLIVNIASQCGYTSQLEGLETIHQKYKDKNFLVLGVPTNDFGGQTPEDDKGMLEFCQRTYNVTFPILSKKTVKGADKRELYKYLTEKTDKKFQGDIGWNFEKFLVNKSGKVIDRYGPSTKPSDRKFRKEIESNL